MVGSWFFGSAVVGGAVVGLTVSAVVGRSRSLMRIEGVVVEMWRCRFSEMGRGKARVCGRNRRRAESRRERGLRYRTRFIAVFDLIQSESG